MRSVPSRPAITVALALLIALAGCSLLGGSATPTGTPPSTTSTTGPSTDRLDPGVRPPGINATALTDPDPLLDSHVERLSSDGYGYELEVNATVRRDSGGEPRTVRVERRSVAYVEPGGAEYRRTLVNAGTGLRFDAWGNRTTEVVRVIAGNGTRYQVADPPDGRALTGAAALGPYLNGSSFAVAGLDREGDLTFVTLTARGLASGVDREAILPPGASNVSDYRARLVVDPAGRIHRLVVTATYDVAGDRARFAFRYRLTATEGVAVDRPSWVTPAGRSDGDAG